MSPSERLLVCNIAEYCCVESSRKDTCVCLICYVHSQLCFWFSRELPSGLSVLLLLLWLFTLSIMMLQFFDNFGYHGTSFEQSYRCYPASFIEKVCIVLLTYVFSAHLSS